MKILENLNIETKNEEIYIRAFTHSSYGYENDCPNYERLEFLGDKILDFFISDYLYRNTNLSEGEMTTLRANYVCEEALYTYASLLNFTDYMMISISLKNKYNRSIIADMFEAFIGALYLDKGKEEAFKFINNVVIKYIESNDVDFLKDYKTVLQNYVQTTKKSVIYEMIDEQGPAHDKIFTCVVKVDAIILGKGIASSKKQAEQEAAKEALTKQAK